jgi:hypothetical protein
MCRITIAHAIRHRISSATLFKRLSIEPFDTYYNRRLLRWTGHVARMPLNRAPRKILTSWVDNPRPLGCPQMNWGRTLKTHMSKQNEQKVRKKYMQSDQPAWNTGGASAKPYSRKIPVFDYAVALCTMQNALLVISDLTWFEIYVLELMYFDNWFRNEQKKDQTKDTYKKAYTCHESI